MLQAFSFRQRANTGRLKLRDQIPIIMGMESPIILRHKTQALSLSPGDGDALYAVGMAYMARGENAAARKYLEAFLGARPELEVATEVREMLAELVDDPN